MQLPLVFHAELLYPLLDRKHVLESHREGRSTAAVSCIAPKHIICQYRSNAEGKRKANIKTWFHKAKSIVGSSITSYYLKNSAGENGLSVSVSSWLRVDREGLQLPLTRLAVLPTLEASSKKRSSSCSFAASSQDRSLCGRGVPFHPSSWLSTMGCENCLFSVYEECPAQKVLRISLQHYPHAGGKGF